MLDSWNDPETLLLGVLTVFLTFLGRLLLKARPIYEPRLTAWVDAKVAEIDNKTFRTIVKNITDAARDIVHELNQVLVSEIRAASEDGKITPQEGKQVLDKGLVKLKSQIDWEKVGPRLEKHGITADKVDDWLIGLLEAEVYRSKMKSE